VGAVTFAEMSARAWEIFEAMLREADAWAWRMAFELITADEREAAIVAWENEGGR